MVTARMETAENLGRHGLRWIAVHAGVLAAALGCGGTSAPAPGTGSAADTRAGVGTGAGAGTTPAAAAADHAPALILTGGAIMTMDPERPQASAVAVGQGRILAVGSDDEIRALAGPDTREIALAGRSVTPGLVDGHAHLYGLGAALESVSLRGMDSEEAAAGAVAASASARPPGEWITGRGWDQNLWAPQGFPTRASLDAAVPDHPVAVRRVDGHALWVNGKALTLAGVTRDTADPPGGRILRHKNGAPTGVLVDAAMDLVEAHIPAPTAAVRERRIRAGAQAAIRAGLTGVHEMGIDDHTVAVYRALAEQGALPLRVYAFLEYDPALIASLPERAPVIDAGNGFFTARGIKIYADGALGSRGAALAQPYSDEPGSRGLMITQPAALAQAARAAAAAGWQLGIHAIGDRGNRAVLDAYQATIEAFPDKDLRFRVEHAQVLAPADIPRFGALGVIASMQPTHATSDMPWAEARLGPARVRGAYAWRAILDAGGRLLGGSDFPVEEVSPLLGLHAAVTRQDRAGHPPGGWYPDQRLSLDEAVALFTTGPAYGSFSDQRRGRIAPGFDADLTVFDRPLSATGLLQTEVDMTIVAGRVVFEAAVP